MAATRTARRRPTRREGILTAPGWSEPTRRALEKLIVRGAGRGWPAVFDFDNTIICGDIGEATLAVLAREGLLAADRLPETFSPAFQVPGQRRVTLPSSTDLTEYYTAYLASTAHGPRDPAPLANAYVWAVEVMENLRPTDVVDATRRACRSAGPQGPGYIEVTPGKTRFPAPFVYPEMVELLAALLRARFDVWILSASNVWSVRWMVQEQLNPRLREHGLRSGLRPDHVVGIATLLTDRRGALYKDAVLVRENRRYATLDERVLGRFRLTSRLQFPVPVYSGKTACLLDALDTRPHLCAGDSPSDLAMLTFSRHRLWIARLDKPGHQRKLAQLLRRTGPARWLIQPTLTEDDPGFVPDLASLPRRLGFVPRPVRKATAILAGLMGRRQAAS